MCPGRVAKTGLKIMVSLCSSAGAFPVEKGAESGGSSHLEQAHKPGLWNLCGGFGVESIRGFQPLWRRRPSSESISVTDHHSDTVLARTVARTPFQVC